MVMFFWFKILNVTVTSYFAKYIQYNLTQTPEGNRKYFKLFKPEGI